MPCYLFTYHSYQSWMPDHPKGYVRRKEGVLAPDIAAGEAYRAHAAYSAVTFNREHQRCIVLAAREAGQYQQFRVHCVATESTHVHVLVSWSDDREWLPLRTKLKESLTRQLNRAFGSNRPQKAPWFSRGSSRRRVLDEAHFTHLVQTYLPSHRGLIWREGDA